MTGQKLETFEPVTLGHIRSRSCRDLLIYCGSARTMALIQSSADGAFVLARWQFRWQEYALVARKDSLVAPPFEGRLEGGDLDRPTASGRDGHDHEAH